MSQEHFQHRTIVLSVKPPSKRSEQEKGYAMRHPAWHRRRALPVQDGCQLPFVKENVIHVEVFMKQRSGLYLVL